MLIEFVKHRKVYFVFSGILILGSLFSLLFFGLKLGIDFTGGSILEIEYKNERPQTKDIQESLVNIGLKEISVQ